MIRLLSDRQKWIIRTTAQQLPPDKAAAFMNRVTGLLHHRAAGYLSDDDISDIAAMAASGLVQRQTDTAA